jgi:hypothetical protein
MSKCPKCDGFITQVQLAEVNIPAGTKAWKGVSYSCPLCQCLLSVGIDPVALKTDMVYEVSQEIKKLQQEIGTLRNHVARLEQICSK